MTAGQKWGELALMYETRSIATYTALPGAELWVLDGRTFQVRSLFCTNYVQDNKAFMKAISSTSICVPACLLSSQPSLMTAYNFTHYHALNFPFLVACDRRRQRAQ